MKSEKVWKMMAISVALLMVVSVAGAVNLTDTSADISENEALDSNVTSSGVGVANEYEIEPVHEHPKMGTGVAMNLPPIGVAPPPTPMVVDIYLTENKTEYIEELRNYTIDILYTEENRVVAKIYISEIRDIADLPFVAYMDTPFQFKLLTTETEYEIEPVHEHPKMGTGVAMNLPPIGVAPPPTPMVVDIYLTENKTEYIEELRNYTIDILYTEENRVVAKIYISEIRDIADLPFVAYMDTPIQFKLCDEVNIDGYKSEGLKCINAGKQHNFTKGGGVKVAVLDFGFLGYEELLGKELPDKDNVTVKSFREDGNISGGGLPLGYQLHGTACAEIIHDVAPDAKLYLVNFLLDYQREKAINYLISEKVDIISHSAGSMVGLFDGTDAPCKTIDNAVFKHGILWVNSAGNEAQRHWEGSFNDAKNDSFPTFILTTGERIPTFNAFYAARDDLIQLRLCWNDTWNYSTQDYQLWACNRESRTCWRSTQPQRGLKDHHPCERLNLYAPASGWYYIGITEKDATKPVYFDLYCWYHDLECAVENSSLVIEATALGSIAVGAVDSEDCSTLEFYSSRGPTNDGRLKPDFVGPTCVSTVSFASKRYFSESYLFGGTSAAAPHVAGALALQLSCIKEKHPGQKDNEYGFGLPRFCVP